MHYFILISLTRFLPGAMQYTNLYKNDLLNPSIIKNATAIQIHLGNLVFSKYLTYIKLRLWHSCMTANEKSPVSFRHVYNMNCNIYGIYETRQAHLLHIPRTKSRFVEILPLYQFPGIWNNWHKQLNVQIEVMTFMHDCKWKITCVI